MHAADDAPARGALAARIARQRRRGHGLEIHTEIAVSPEDDIELRRARIVNRSRTRKVIELTTYAEIVLAPPAEDLIHPAFSKLFVQTEIVRDKHLEAKPEQVRAMVQDVAQTYEQPDAVVRWHFEKPERLSEFEALAVEHNVVEWVIAQAKVTDAPTTFEALMGPAQS